VLRGEEVTRSASMVGCHPLGSCRFWPISPQPASTGGHRPMQTRRCRSGRSSYCVTPSRLVCGRRFPRGCLIACFPRFVRTARPADFVRTARPSGDERSAQRDHALVVGVVESEGLSGPVPTPLKCGERIGFPGIGRVRNARSLVLSGFFYTEKAGGSRRATEIRRCCAIGN
jgi:hypothetical protein